MNKKETKLLNSIKEILPKIKDSVPKDVEWIGNFAIEYLNNMKEFIELKNDQSEEKALKAIGGVAKTVGDSWSWGETKVGDQFWKIVNCFDKMYIKD